MLSFHLDHEFVDRYRDRPEPFGFGSLGAVTFYRTYARVKPDGNLESWADACERIINGMYTIQKDYASEHGVPWSDDKAKESAHEAYDRLFNLKWSPPGRGLYHMGAPSVHERNMVEATNNCAFTSTQSIRDHKGHIFEWVMEMLMLGVGVGFDIRGAGLVEIVKPRDTDLNIFVIPDSREGWADSIGRLVSSYIPNGDVQHAVTFDYSLIRPKGSLIRGFGGVASGYEPLEWLHDKVRTILDDAHGDRISGRIITDIMNMIGVVVVAGNVRRSSEIALGSPFDTEFANLKNYTQNPERKEWGWSSNNSVFANVGMDYKPFVERIMDNGEPGFVWLENANKYARMNGIEDHRDLATGVNPCFRGDTLIRTKNGDVPIVDLVGETADIWDGSQWVAIDNFRVTGTNQKVLRIELQDGTELFVTPYHTMVLDDGTSRQAKDIVAGDKLQSSTAPESHGDLDVAGAYVKGFMLGDGTSHGTVPALWLYDTKKVCAEKIVQSLSEIPARDGRSDMISEPNYTDGEYSNGRSVVVIQGLRARDYDIMPWATTYKDKLPFEVFGWNRKSKLELIAGIFDSDGTAFDTNNGFGYQLSSVRREFLLDVQTLLKSIGVHSKLAMSHEAGIRDFGDGYGEYKAKECWRLSIAQHASIVLSNQIQFARLDNLHLTCKTTYQYTLKWNTVVKIEPAGTEDKVYCCTVPTSHRISLSCGIETGQCGEQFLYGWSPAGVGGELCVAGDTQIQTEDGIFRISDLVNKRVKIWNGEEWSEVTPFLAGTGSLYRVTLSDGSYLDATPKHEWIAKTKTQAKYRTHTTDSLEVGMVLPKFEVIDSGGTSDKHAYELGWFTGDGYIDDNRKALAVIQENEYFIGQDAGWNMWKEQHPAGYSRPFRRVNFSGEIDMDTAVQLRDHDAGLASRIMRMDADGISEFMGGWIDADGSIAKNPNTQHYVLYGSEQKLRDAQILLRRIGVNHATIRLLSPTGTITNYGRRNYDLWRMFIPSYECSKIKTRLKVIERFGSEYQENHAHKNSKPISRAKRQRVVSIKLISDSEPTYCFNEPMRHMGVFGNVITKQCTLVELYPNRHDSFYDFARSIKFAYLYGKSITLLSEKIAHPGTRQLMMQNRRIGLSMTGIAQFVASRGMGTLVKWAEDGYSYVKHYDKRYSNWFGVNESVRVTTVKPSGTVSLVAGATPGVHHPVAEYYIRRVRFSDNSHLAERLREAGVHIEIDDYSPNTVVAEFPIHAGDNLRRAKDLTIWEQFNLAAMMQRHWSDNSVSVTISVNPESTTAQELSIALDHYQHSLKSVSMLPEVSGGAYTQMPYEEINEVRYGLMEMKIDYSKLKNLNIKNVAPVDRLVDAYCDGDACQIPFVK